MAVYAIGDVQGCLQPLRNLIDAVGFDPARDRLWFVGDLVNRGPDSLGVLRLVKNLGDAAITVLGNHDLHLLAIAHGNDRHDKADPGMHAVLRAPDGDALLDWLQQRPVLHHDPELQFAMTHAGISPQWDRDTALACARELDAVLRSNRAPAYFRALYGNAPSLWHDRLQGMERLRYITNAFTRTRFCHPDGSLNFSVKTGPEEVRGLIPWFLHPDRRPWPDRIVFGHWSMLGYHDADGVYGIDTGCLWGGALTALWLDPPDGRPVRFSLDCRS